MASRAAPLFALILVTALAGCAHEKVGLDGYRWAYLAEAGEGPRLAYGRPNSDDVVLMMGCHPGRDDIEISAVGASGGEMVLASGRSESRFSAARIDDAMSEGLFQARGSAKAPALEAFRRSGDLALMNKGERHSLSAGSADKGQVRAFFKACGV